MTPHTLRTGPVFRALATLLAVVHVFAIGVARFAERPESTVAAVHVETAGTSLHHAHAELCAVCAASHLTAPPSRYAERLTELSAKSTPLVHRTPLLQSAARLQSRSRAPPA
jgi:hypothetical protein